MYDKSANSGSGPSSCFSSSSSSSSVPLIKATAVSCKPKSDLRNQPQSPVAAGNLEPALDVDAYSPTRAHSANQLTNAVFIWRQRLNCLTNLCMGCLLCNKPAQDCRHSMFSCQDLNTQYGVTPKQIQAYQELVQKLANFSCCFCCRLPQNICTSDQGSPLQTRNCVYRNIVLETVICGLAMPNTQRLLGEHSTKTTADIFRHFSEMTDYKGMQANRLWLFFTRIWDHRLSHTVVPGCV